jgi:hypothetical protein
MGEAKKRGTLEKRKNEAVKNLTFTEIFASDEDYEHILKEGINAGVNPSMISIVLKVEFQNIPGFGFVNVSSTYNNSIQSQLILIFDKNISTPALMAKVKASENQNKKIIHDYVLKRYQDAQVIITTP